MITYRVEIKGRKARSDEKVTTAVVVQAWSREGAKATVRDAQTVRARGVELVDAVPTGRVQLVGGRR